MAHFYEYQIHSAATISASANGTGFANASRSDNPVVTLDVTVGSITTTPNVVFTLMASVDGVNFAIVQAFTAITAAGNYRFVTTSPVYEPFIRLDVTFTGSGSLNNVNSYILLPGPEEN